MSSRAALLVLALWSASAAAQDAPKEPDPATDPDTDPGRRIRLGFSMDGGLHLPALMGVLGVQAHVGFQVTRWFGVFGAVGGVLGVGAGTAHLGYGYFATLAEVIIADLLYFAVGPAIALGAISSPTVNTQTSFSPGVDLRVGIGLGRARKGWFGRGGFNFGLDLMTLVHPGAGVSFIPMAQVGYEWR